VLRLKPRLAQEGTQAARSALHRGRDSAELPQIHDKPVLLVDIDGVISLFGFPWDKRPEGTWHNVEGMAHFLSSAAVGHLHELAQWFDPVWCSGWEEKAGEHLPTLLGAPVLPHLSFDRTEVGVPVSANAHWKLAAIEAHAGDRPLAWVDDALDERVEAWADARSATAPTLLVPTDPAVGLTAEHVGVLRRWALGTVGP
jgi:hypothetical protein